MGTQPAPIYPEQDLTERILAAAFAVHNTLGSGFLEKVYSNALLIEVRGLGLACEHEVAFKVKYRNVEVGDYFADLIVERRVVVELKACASLDSAHEAQILNYLKASNIRVGLLLNFWKAETAVQKIREMTVFGFHLCKSVFICGFRSASEVKYG